MSFQILIVDANPLSAENLKGRLAHLGQATVLAEAKALDGALARRWDLVVTDWALAELSGPALMNKLGALEKPLYLYTDQTEVVEQGSWRDLGVVQAYTRLQRADLILAVEEALRPVPAAGANPAFLLVEDSATARQFVKSVLQSAYPGCELFEAEDGRAALAAMRNSRISLIITDLQMPGMDGMSFVQLLRNNGVLKRKPVLVLSGAVTDEIRASLDAFERLRILAKPAQAADLLAAVRLLLA